MSTPYKGAFDQMRARELRAQGLSIRTIASVIGCGKETIRRLLDPEKFRESVRQQYATNPGPARARVKRWAENNGDRVRSRVKAWADANPTRVRDNHRAWSVSAAGRIASKGYTARRRAVDCLTTAEIQSNIAYAAQLFNGHCAYCGRDVSKTYELEHVLAVTRGGTNSLSNLVPACHSCNSSKNDSVWRTWYREQVFWSQEREERIASHLASNLVTTPPGVDVAFDPADVIIQDI